MYTYNNNPYLYQLQMFNTYTRNLNEFIRNHRYVCEMCELEQRQKEISQNNYQNEIPQPFKLVEYDQEIYSLASWLVNQTALSLECGLLSASACINSTTRGMVYIKIRENLVISSVIQGIIFANSGARKSIVVDRLIDPFVSYESNQNNSLTGEQQKLLDRIIQFKNREILRNIDINDSSSVIRALSEIDNYTKKINQTTGMVSKNILLSGMTEYGLMRFLQQNYESALILNPEGSDFEKFLKTGDLELFLKTFGQEPFIKKTGRYSIHLKHPALYTAIFAQPDIAMEIYGSDKLNMRGVMARLLPCINSFNAFMYNNPFVDDSMSAQYSKKISYLLNSLAKMASTGQKYHISLDPQSMREFENFVEACSCMVTDSIYFKQFLSKLPGNACKLALAAHICNNPEHFTGKPITKLEMHHGRILAEKLAEFAYYLFSPLGFTAHDNAMKIITSWHRIPDGISRTDFIICGTDSTSIQQRTGMNRQDVNHALYFLANCKIVAIADNGTGNLQVRLHYKFFDMKLL